MKTVEVYDSLIVTALKQLLLRKVAYAYEFYMDINGFANRRIRKQSEIVDIIADKHAVMSLEDFKSCNPEVPTERYYNAIENYVDANFDEKYLQALIERELDFDAIKEDLREEAAMQLGDIRPYHYLPNTFWYSKMFLVLDIQELVTYASGKGLTYFTERYAPEWEDRAREIHGDDVRLTL